MPSREAGGHAVQVKDIESNNLVLNLESSKSERNRDQSILGQRFHFCRESFGVLRGGRSFQLLTIEESTMEDLRMPSREAGGHAVQVKRGGQACRLCH